MTSRDYCFTAWQVPMYDESKIRYITWGVEICPTTGKTHWQGYVVLKSPQRMKAAQTIIGASTTCHIEKKRGSRDEARTYCHKDDNVYEWGQYDPNTHESLFKKPIGELKADYPEFFCRYYKGLERLQSHGPKWRDVKVHVLWGEPGTGKTRQVMEMDDVYKIDSPYKWWDGYEGETIILIDDYEEGDIPRGMLKHLLDGYRYRLETKGSHLWALWTTVYVTTNYNPSDWIDSIKGLRRRVTSVTLLQG